MVWRSFLRVHPGVGQGSAKELAAGDDVSRSFNVDADVFKRLQLRQALTDGSYESWLIPEDVRRKGQRGSGCGSRHTRQGNGPG